MRFPIFAVFFLSTVITMTIPAYSATFTDDMAVAQNTAETRFFGLKPYSSSTHGLSDQSLLTFSNAASPLGGAIYRVNGAEMITVGIYSLFGTGVLPDASSLTLGQGTVQAKWSKSENSVCSDYGGSSWKLALDLTTVPVFEPVNTLPNDLVGYGLNIYSSTDGNSFGKPLSASVTKSVSEALYYEEYTAYIPASAKYIKVEINDVTSFPLLSGGAMNNPRYIGLALARISGESLVMGEPAAPVQPPYTVIILPDNYEEEEPPEDENSAGKADLDIEIFEAEETAPEEKPSSSKFEGTITSSSKEQKKSPSKESVPESESSSKKPESSASDSSQPEPPREEIYEIRREKKDEPLTSGVTAYVVVALVALGFALAFGKGPNIKK